MSPSVFCFLCVVSIIPTIVIVLFSIIEYFELSKKITTFQIDMIKKLLSVFLISTFIYNYYYSNAQEISSQFDVIKKNNVCYIYFDKKFINISREYSRNFDDCVEVYYIPKGQNILYGIVSGLEDEITKVK